jgi:rfaE bifunctional protein kinase chain/domain
MNESRLVHLLSRFSDVKLIVLGDYFLDSYLVLDRSLSEISVETGLEAYQVASTRKSPGAAGTVVSNLRALGVNVFALGLYGDDGNGYDLHKRLVENHVDISGLIQVPGYATPTYIKPMMREADGCEHELNRMDIKQRSPLSASLENKVIDRMRSLLPNADGMLVVDQVQERNCGVITTRVREELQQLALSDPNKVIVADSRQFLSEFKSILLKVNIEEAALAAGHKMHLKETFHSFAERCGRELIAQSGKPVIITLGSEGIFLLESPDAKGVLIPARKVTGPIDIVGAGDSVNAAFGAALCSGASLVEAGYLATLVAAIVVQQIGVTGTASPQQIIDLLHEEEV